MWRLWLLPMWARIALSVVAGASVVAGGMFLVTNALKPPTTADTGTVAMPSLAPIVPNSSTSGMPSPGGDTGMMNPSTPPSGTSVPPSASAQPSTQGTASAPSPGGPSQGAPSQAAPSQAAPSQAAPSQGAPRPTPSGTGIPQNSQPVYQASPSQRAPRIPLPPNSFQNDFAPVGMDLNEVAFVYASTPLEFAEFAKFLVPELQKAGWKISNQKSDSAQVSFDVVSPEGLTGSMIVLPTEPGIPEHKSRVISELTRPKPLQAG